MEEEPGFRDFIRDFGSSGQASAGGGGARTAEGLPAPPSPFSKDQLRFIQQNVRAAAETTGRTAGIATSTLRERALACGVDMDALEAAEADEDDPKGRMIALILGAQKQTQRAPEAGRSRGEGLPYLRRDSSDSSAILRQRDSSDAESSVGFH